MLRKFIHGNQDSRPGIFILVVVVACILGIIGFPKNVQELKDNLHNRIHLGLDLKGGTNLILQVQVEDAVNITADEALERLKDELKAKNIPYADIQPDDDKTQNPPIHRILIKGIPQERVIGPANLGDRPIFRLGLGSGSRR